MASELLSVVGFIQAAGNKKFSSIIMTSVVFYETIF